MKALRDVLEASILDMDSVLAQGDEFEALMLNLKKEFKLIKSMKLSDWKPSADRKIWNEWLWECPNFIKHLFDLDDCGIMFKYTVYGEDKIYIPVVMTYVYDKDGNTLSNDFDTLVTDGNVYPNRSSMQKFIISQIKKVYNISNLKTLETELKANVKFN